MKFIYMALNFYAAYNEVKYLKFPVHILTQIIKNRFPLKCHLTVIV